MEFYAAWRAGKCTGRNFTQSSRKYDALRRVVTSSLYVLLFFTASSSLAQVRTVPGEYSKIMKDKEAVASLKSDLFGDEVNTSTGQIEFSVTDLSVPGNSDLPVEVRRRFVVEDRNSDGYLYGFGNWDIDVPYLKGTFAASTGWVSALAGTENTTARCSTANGPNMVGPFTSDRYWAGNTMHIPGAGDQEMLTPAAGLPAGPTYYTKYTWTTAANWRFACLPSTKNAYPGESFVAVSPDGKRYYFDYVITRQAKPISRTGYYAGGVLHDTSGAPLERVTVFFMATKVEDRFGNWVTYTYQGDKLSRIASNDGRAIDVRYDQWGQIDLVSTSTTNRNYSYSNGSLTKVSLPDGSSWTYSGTGGDTVGRPEWMMIEIDYSDTNIDPGSAQCYYVNRPGAVTPFVYTIKHPSGAIGRFTIELSSHGRSNVERVCRASTGTAGSFKYAPVFNYFALTKKEITGPSMGQQVWTYVKDSRANLSWCQIIGDPNLCPNSRDFTVTEPDGTKNVYTIGQRFRINEGQVLAVKTYAADGSLVRSQTNSYVANEELTGQKFLERLGESAQNKSDGFIGIAVRPLKSTTTTQQGVNFSSTVDSGCAGAGLYCFDVYARALKTTRASTLGYSTTESTAYYDNTSKWVLGQTASVTCNAPATCAGTVMSKTDYDTATGLPLRDYAFGKFQQLYTYNTDGTLATSKDGNQNVTTFSGWKRGIPQTIKYMDGTSITASVDDNGWIRSATNENGTGYTTAYDYDAMGRLKLINYPDETSLVWNNTTVAFAPNTTATYGLPAGYWRQVVSTGNLRKVTHFDAMWRPVVEESYDAKDATTAANTRSIVVKRYDESGRLTFQSYPMRSLTSYTQALSGTTTLYDALGRTTTVTQGSELGALTTKTEYLSGFKTKITTPRQHVTTTSYMAYDSPSTDWPISVVHPQGAFTEIERDAYGKPSWVRRRNADSSQAVVRYYAYNGYQELCKTIEPETGATLMGYDGAGNLRWSAAGLPTNLTCHATGDDATINPRKITRTYDLRNRLKTLAFADGQGNQTWTYTPDGLPASVAVINPNVANPTKTSYIYNRRRLLTGEGLSHLGDSAAWGLGYGYDANGSLSTQTYPSGLTVDYAPNALGQATKVGPFAAGVSYYPNGAIAQFTYGNSIKHSLTQNSRQFPARSLDDYGSSKFIDDTYAYDANANVATIRDGTPGNRGNRDMSYDGLDRLIKVKSAVFGAGADQSATYGYDALDNLTNVLVGGPKPRIHYYCYDTRWRLTNIKTGSCASGTTSYGLGYDAQGNLANKNGQTFTFDLGNRMRRSNSPSYWYAYDGYGRRILSCTSAACNYQQYSQSGQLAITEDKRNQKRTESIYLGGSLVALRELDRATNTLTTKYQHTDALGSPVAVTDQNRVVIDKSEYEPFGQQIFNRPATDGPGYTGHVFDSSTGLNYMQQRYYDPMIGRFLSVDPVSADSATGSNFNRYWYANNNPYKFKDPDGRIVDTIADIGFIAYDIYALATEPSWTNGAALGADLVGAAVPFATGLGAGVRGAIHGAEAVDKASDVAKGAEKANGVLKSVVEKKPGGGRVGDFTRAQKEAKKAENAAKNGGKMKCEKCSKEVENIRSQKGQGTPDNQAQIHHDPALKDGGGRDSKAVLLCPACHRAEHAAEKAAAKPNVPEAPKLED